MGTAKAKDKKEDFLSQVIQRLNEMFITDQLLDSDMIGALNMTVGQPQANEKIMKQTENNSRDQVIRGDFPDVVEDALLSADEAFKEIVMQLFSDAERMNSFKSLAYDVLMNSRKNER